MKILAVHKKEKDELERLRPNFENQERLYRWVEYADALTLRAKIMEQLGEQKLEVLEISAHADTNFCDNISTATLPEYARNLKKLPATADCKILLSGCHSGVKLIGQNPISQELARISGYEVWGAMGYLWYTLAEQESGITESDGTLRKPYIKQENNLDDARYPRQYDPNKIWRKFLPTPLALQARNKIDLAFSPKIATRFRVYRFGGVAAPSDETAQEILELIAANLNGKTAQQRDFSRIGESARFEIHFGRSRVVFELLNRENLIRWRRRNKPDLYWPASSEWRDIVNSLFCLPQTDLSATEDIAGSDGENTKF